jgi:uncharacterized membrane protein
MTKQEFLASLREGLRGLPPADVEERIAFYDEMIDDRMEEGLTEEEALEELGSVESVIAQIAAETPLVKLVKEKVRRERKRSGKGLTTVLLALGSPIWVSLLIAAAAVVFSLVVAAWSVVIALYGPALSLVVSGAACAIFSIFYILRGNIPGAAFAFGAGVAAIGLGLLLFPVCNALARALIKGMKKLVLGFKSLLMRRKGAE